MSMSTERPKISEKENVLGWQREDSCLLGRVSHIAELRGGFLESVALQPVLVVLLRLPLSLRASGRSQVGQNRARRRAVRRVRQRRCARERGERRKRRSATGTLQSMHGNACAWRRVEARCSGSPPIAQCTSCGQRYL